MKHFDLLGNKFQNKILKLLAHNLFFFALDFVEYEKVGHTLEDIKIKNIEVKELEQLS